jgi:hypothetical protein
VAEDDDSRLSNFLRFLLESTMKEWLAKHHSGYLAFIAILLVGYLLYHEIQTKPFTQTNNKILKQVVEPAKWH